MASACVTQGRQRGLPPFEPATNARAGLHDVCNTERCMAITMQTTSLFAISHTWSWWEERALQVDVPQFNQLASALLGQGWMQQA